jgi:hypothetical protein
VVAHKWSRKCLAAGNPRATRGQPAAAVSGRPLRDRACKQRTHNSPMAAPAPAPTPTVGHDMAAFGLLHALVRETNAPRHLEVCVPRATPPADAATAAGRQLARFAVELQANLAVQAARAAPPRDQWAAAASVLAIMADEIAALTATAPFGADFAAFAARGQRPPPARRAPTHLRDFDARCIQLHRALAQLAGAPCSLRRCLCPRAPGFPRLCECVRRLVLLATARARARLAPPTEQTTPTKRPAEADVAAAEIAACRAPRRRGLLVAPGQWA